MFQNVLTLIYAVNVFRYSFFVFLTRKLKVFRNKLFSLSLLKKVTQYQSAVIQIKAIGQADPCAKCFISAVCFKSNF